MIHTDVVIIGAGPCGLFQVFELGLLGLQAELVDSIRQPGGQCAELYPDKPIYDIPGIPVCSGEELTAALLKQIEPFKAGMHLGEEVSVVRKNSDDSFHVETNTGTQFHAKADVIAGGVGSFQPRQLRVAGAEEFAHKTLHYRIQDPQQFAGKKLAILGGGDSALDWVLELINVDTERFETSEPGIYAIKHRIEPDKKAHLQYTTTSPLMHKRLGVAD